MTTMHATAGGAYRRRADSAAVIALKSEIRSKIAAARDTAKQGAGRMDRCNDLVRGRPFDLQTIAACVDELVRANCEPEKVKEIGYVFPMWIAAQLPAPRITFAEAQKQETHLDGLLDEAQMEAASNPSCPGALSRLVERALQQKAALVDLMRVALHRQREVAR
jgi:hypothetical protein